MWRSDQWKDYELIDCGRGEKLERWGGQMPDEVAELAKKAKSEEGLTPEEMVERDLLRQEYIAAYRNNLVAQLENTYIVEPDRTKHKLGKKP